MVGTWTGVVMMDMVRSDLVIIYGISDIYKNKIG